MPLLLRLLFDLANLALDLSSLTDAVTQIVELSTANLTASDLFDVVDLGGVERENSLYADTIGYAANCDSFSYAAALTSDEVAFEKLKSFALTFLDFQVNLDQVADLKLGQVCADLGLFYEFDKFVPCVFSPLYSGVLAACAADRL